MAQEMPEYNSWADWVFLTLVKKLIKEKKNSNSNLLNSVEKLTLCHILFVRSDWLIYTVLINNTDSYARFLANQEEE